MNYLKRYFWAACLMIACSAFADEFAPTVMEIAVPEQVAYRFDGSSLEIDVAISGVGGQFWLVINTNGQAENINMVRNGFMGWHTVNKIDTTVYISQPYTFQPGMRMMSWNGTNSEGDYVLSDSYDYYVYGYDNINERVPVCMFIQAASGWRPHNTFILEEDENGQSLANPILTTTVQSYQRYKDQNGDYYEQIPDWCMNGNVLKWVVGADPFDFHNLQWTRCHIYPSYEFASDPGYLSAGGSAFNPQDHNLFYHVCHDVDNEIATFQKWYFINNGNAVLDEDWDGYNTSWEKPMPIGFYSAPMSTVTDGTYLYINDSEQTGVSENPSQNWLRCFDFNGTEVFSKNMHEFYMPDDNSRYEKKSCAMLDLEPGTYENSMFIGTMGCCMHEFIDTTSLINGTGSDEADYLRWRNGQGDFYFDVYWESNADFPWACLNNAEQTSHRIDSVQVDANGFNIIYATFIGNASHGVSTQDGTSLMGAGFMSFADDDESYYGNNYRGGGKVVDYGSNFDGMYTTPPLTIDGGGGLHVYQTWYAANASAGGVIENPFQGENYFFVYGQIIGAGECVVSIENPDQGFYREVTSDSDGNYLFSDIPNGVYTLYPMKAGYRYDPRMIPVIVNNNVHVKDIVAEIGEARYGTLSISSPEYESSENYLEVVIDGSDMEALFGVSFTLNVSPYSFIEDIYITPGSLLGDNIVFFQNTIDGEISLALSRKAGQGDVTGSGNLATVFIKMEAGIPDSTQIHFELADIEGKDASGIEVLFDGTFSDDICILSDQLLSVWPGDTNNNGTVTQSDILPLGMCWSMQGPPRKNASLYWIRQTAEPWDNMDATYADANGDGIVNQADILPVGLNWGLTQSIAKPAGTHAASIVEGEYSGQLVVSHSQDVSFVAGSEFWLDITAVNVDALFGVSFEIETDGNTYLEPVFAEVGSFLGDDVLFFYDIDAENNAVSLGITKKREQQDASGSGVIARVKYNVIRDITPDAMISLAMTDILGNCASGSAVTLSCEPLAVGYPDVLVAESSRELSISNNYPNPFNPTTTIAYTLPEEGFITITIYNASGQKVETITEDLQSAGHHSVVWNAESKPSGLYFYTITGNRFSETRKMLLIK